MKYKIKPHVTEEMLEACGYIFEGHDGFRHGIKKCRKGEIYVLRSWGCRACDYRDPNINVLMWNDIDKKTKINPFIQDIIDNDYVQELK